LGRHNRRAGHGRGRATGAGGPRAQPPKSAKAPEPRGWNWRAVIATCLGGLLAVGGAYTATGTSGPFPANGLIPVFKGLYNYSRVVGFAVGFVVYLLLSVAQLSNAPAVETSKGAA
jgi:cytosine/uracil/thiamine/allantoin permease